MLSLTNLTYLLYNHLPMRFTFSVQAGERLAILGPSGAGKSTLLNLIAGFLPISGGELELNSVDHRATPPEQRPVSILFQENNLFSHLTVAQNIGLGLHPCLKLNHQQKQELQNIAQSVGLSEQLQHLPHQLSGGQRQRTALARCLVRKQPILLLDEPFSALDPGLRKEILGLVDKVCRERHITLLMVSHSIEDAANIAGRSLLIVDGQVYWDGSIMLLQRGAVPEATVLGVVLKKLPRVNDEKSALLGEIE